MLTDDQIERYSRHILLPEVGGKGQARLLASSVLVCGDGPAAECCAAYLAAAGVDAVAWQGEAAPLFLAGPVASEIDEPSLVVEIGAAGPAQVPAIRAAISGDRVTVARGRCRDCLTLAAPVASNSDRAEVGALAGSLAATEALLMLSGVDGIEGRVLELDLASGRVEQRAAPRCAGCQGRMEKP